MILAVMQGHAGWQLGLSVVEASVAQVHVNSKVQAQCVDQLLDHVTLKISVLASLVTAQRTYTTRMEPLVTITRPIATQESAKPMMHSVKETLNPVRTEYKYMY